MIRAFVRAVVLAAIAAASQFSLLASANAQAYRQDYPPQFSMSPKGVNIQTGRLAYETTDFTIGPLKLVRTIGDGPIYSGGGRRFGPIVAGQDSGHGWTHNYASGIKIDTPSYGNTFYRVTVDNIRYTFKLLLDGNLVPADATTQGMKIDVPGSGQFAVTDHSGNVYSFTTLTASGNPIVLTRTLYANGSATSIQYNSAAQPELVTSNLGYAIVFDYNASQNISAACGFNTTQTYVTISTTCAAGPVVKVSYGYDATGSSLTSFTDARNGVTSYTYATGGLGCVSLVNSATCAIQNVYGGGLLSQPDQVTTQTTAAGNVWTYGYNPPPDPNDVPPTPCYPIWSTASASNSATNTAYFVRYDRGFATRVDDPSGSTYYKYANGCWTQGLTQVEARFQKPSLIRKPGGIREYYAYDSRGNLTIRAVFPNDVPDPKLVGGGDWIPTDTQLEACCVNLGTPQIPAGSLVYGWVYPPSWGAIGQSGQTYTLGCGSGPSDAKLCDKPTAVIDPNGNQTDYTYDAAHGGMLTETKPAPVAGGVRPQTRFAYTQRQAWIKNSTGTYSQTGENVWLLASKSLCKTKSWNGSACVNASGVADASDLVTTTYDYGPNSGPNNLLLLSVTEDSGTGRLNLRTSYTYDAQGNKISETKPLGAGAAPANPVFSISAPAPVNEGGLANFTITKTGTASGTLTVDYATANLTAVAPGDYTAKSGTLSFPAATTSMNVSVQTNPDSVNEGSETFKMTLSNPSAGASLGTSSATATINNVTANQPPVTQPDTASGFVCTAGPTVNVIANDSDPENTPLTVISVVSLNSAMTASVSGTTSVHVHNSSGALGSMDARYTVQDGGGATATGILTVNWADNGSCL